MASQGRMTARDRTAMGAGALALLFAAAIGAAPSGCGFHTNGLVPGTGGSGGAAATSSHSSAATTSTGPACSPQSCDDHNVCTVDTCSGGMCSHTNEAAGVACGTGLTCDGQGQCKGCTASSQCTGGTPCTPKTCDKSVCVPHKSAEGTPCMDMATMGVCSAQEVCVACLDKGKTVLPAPGCMNMDYCSVGVCASCMDAVANGDETDLNCGGKHCPGCDLGLKCKVTADCVANAQCINGKCANCTDGMKDGDETGVDCGGSCPACDGDACSVGGTCKSTFCVAGLCCDKACTNNVSGTKCESCALPGQTGTCTQIPSGVDGSPTCGPSNLCDGMGVCQGITMMKKPVGQPCGSDGECFNNNCKLGACRLKAGQYCNASLECGTDFCSPEHICASCGSDNDCASGDCASGTCKLPSSAVCRAKGDCAIDDCTNNFCAHPGTGSSAPCVTEADCATHLCNGGGKCANCGSDIDCPSTKCNTQNGACLAPAGDYCLQDFDCASGHCNPSAASPIFKTCQ